MILIHMIFANYIKITIASANCDVDEFIGTFVDKYKFDLKKELKNIKVPQVLFLARDIVVEPNTENYLS